MPLFNFLHTAALYFDQSKSPFAQNKWKHLRRFGFYVKIKRRIKLKVNNEPARETIDRSCIHGYIRKPSGPPCAGKITQGVYLGSIFLRRTCPVLSSIGTLICKRFPWDVFRTRQWTNTHRRTLTPALHSVFRITVNIRLIELLVSRYPTFFVTMETSACQEVAQTWPSTFTDIALSLGARWDFSKRKPAPNKNEKSRSTTAECSFFNWWENSWNL